MAHISYHYPVLIQGFEAITSLSGVCGCEDLTAWGGWHTMTWDSGKIKLFRRM
jgi:hypothetical protein